MASKVGKAILRSVIEKISKEQVEIINKNTYKGDTNYNVILDETYFQSLHFAETELIRLYFYFENYS